MFIKKLVVWRSTDCFKALLTRRESFIAEMPPLFNYQGNLLLCFLVLITFTSNNPPESQLYSAALSKLHDSINVQEIAHLNAVFLSLTILTIAIYRLCFLKITTL